MQSNQWNEQCAKRCRLNEIAVRNVIQHYNKNGWWKTIVAVAISGLKYIRSQRHILISFISLLLFLSHVYFINHSTKKLMLRRRFSSMFIIESNYMATRFTTFIKYSAFSMHICSGPIMSWWSYLILVWLGLTSYIFCIFSRTSPL
jgi:hypothetical protein